VSVVSIEAGLAGASKLGKISSLAVKWGENWQQKLEGAIEGGLDQLPSL
jgi:hypothetical protein